MEWKKSYSWIVRVLILTLVLIFAWNFLAGLGSYDLGPSQAVIYIVAALAIIAVILFFIFSGIGLVLLGAFSFIGIVVGIILFTSLYPILIALLIVMICLYFFSKDVHLKKGAHRISWEKVYFWVFLTLILMIILTYIFGVVVFMIAMTADGP